MNQDKIANTGVHLESTEPRSKACHMEELKNDIKSKHGCPYCTMSKDGNIVGKDFGEGEYHVVITNTGRICSKMSIWDFSTRSVKINFCPMCGTELKSNDN